MTPIAAIVLGLLAGWFIPRSRRPAALAAISYLGVLLALACGIAAAVSALRARKAGRQHSATPDRLGPSHRATVLATTLATSVPTSATVLLFLANAHSTVHNRSGKMPVSGLIGIVGGLLILAVIAISLARRPRRPAEPVDGLDHNEPTLTRKVTA